MLNLLLESIYMFSEWDDDTDILVYTTTEFAKQIKASSIHVNNRVFYAINDTIDTIDKATKTRLDLFFYPFVDMYERIFYLDTDVLVLGNINKAFNVVNRDVLYALEEGTFDHYCKERYWGNNLFSAGEVSQHVDMTAFSSGVMLFNNCGAMKYLFMKSRDHIMQYASDYAFYDQAYIIYNAVRFNLYDNKTLKGIVFDQKNMSFGEIKKMVTKEGGKTVIHFSGDVGSIHNKEVFIKDYMVQIKERKSDESIAMAREQIRRRLFPVIARCNTAFPGTLMTLPSSPGKSPMFILNGQQHDSAKNIAMLLLNRNCKNVVQLGFDGGLTATIMLLTNPHVKVTCVEFNESVHTYACYEQMRILFDYRIELIVASNDNDVSDRPYDFVRSLRNEYQDGFDLVHIVETSKDIAFTRQRLLDASNLAKEECVVVFDGCHDSEKNELWHRFCSVLDFKPLCTYLKETAYQSVRMVLKDPARCQGRLIPVTTVKSEGEETKTDRIVYM